MNSKSLSALIFGSLLTCTTVAGCAAPEAPVVSTIQAGQLKPKSIIPGSPGTPLSAECIAQWDCFCSAPSACAPLCASNTTCTDENVDGSFDCKTCGATLCTVFQEPCSSSYPPDPPFSCTALYPGLATCGSEYTDPPACDESITAACISDGNLVCSPEMTWVSCCAVDDSFLGAICGDCTYADPTDLSYCGL